MVMRKGPDERVDPEYPAQEGEIGCNDGSKLTCETRKEVAKCAAEMQS